MLFNVVLQLQLKYELKSLHFCSKPCFFKEILKKMEVSLSFSEIYVAKNVKKKQDLDMDR